MKISCSDTIHELTKGFDPIGLSEMDGVELMNRTDTKYVFPVSKLPELLRLARGKYRILEIDNERRFDYNTTYLDTCDYSFFCQQATGRAARHKVRYRTYESTNTTFLEVKRKTNKNRTIKWRIKNGLLQGACDDEAMKFLQEFVPDECTRLKPILINRFKRLTLVGLESGERITLDYEMSFSDGNDLVTQLPYLAIAELKREGYSNRSPFVSLIKQLSIRPSGFSKYCMGCVMLYDMPRKNAFKQKFLLLNKIAHEYHSHYA
jgi:hypothetical protein